MFAIDFEASCLPRHGRSFPIEVGIASQSGWTRSWLIRPEPDWASWTWNEGAERLHGISRAQLFADGRSVTAVMAELNAALTGCHVIADHDLDRYWLGTLATAARVPSRFGIEHIASVIEEYRPSRAMIDFAKAEADWQVPTRHRAGPDALWLATFATHIVPHHAEALHFETAWSTSASSAAERGLSDLALVLP